MTRASAISTTTVHLRPEKRKARVLHGHPWVFSGEVLEKPDPELDGQIVDVADGRGRFIGRGFYNSHSNILVRVVERDLNVPVDDGWWDAALDRALARRAAAGVTGDAFRAVYGEADGLPGFVADKYGDYVVVQVLAKGIEDRRELLATRLAAKLGVKGVYERSDVGIRRLEGLAERTGVLWGAEPPAELTIHEGECSYRVDIRHGQKTGFFLDQRANRAAVGALAKGKRVLNAFCYTGGFSIACARGGAAAVDGVDVDGAALAVGAANAADNGVADRCHWIEANAFDWLRQAVTEQRQYDLVILDPPAFTKNKDSVPGALRGYKEINLRAMKLLPPGGLLATFSCSHHLERELFWSVLAEAAQDARREARVLAQFHQGPDHPAALAVPESEYLKGFLIAVG